LPPTEASTCASSVWDLRAPRSAQEAGGHEAAEIAQAAAAHREQAAVALAAALEHLSARDRRRPRASSADFAVGRFEGVDRPRRRSRARRVSRREAREREARRQDEERAAGAEGP
jgi:hypothetical protein